MYPEMAMKDMLYFIKEKGSKYDGRKKKRSSFKIYARKSTKTH